MLTLRPVYGLDTALDALTPEWTAIKARWRILKAAVQTATQRLSPRRSAKAAEALRAELTALGPDASDDAWLDTILRHAEVYHGCPAGSLKDAIGDQPQEASVCRLQSLRENTLRALQGALADPVAWLKG